MELVEIIEWLRSIEDLAFQLYRKAAEKFKDRQELFSFLDHLAGDETWHYHLMGSAVEMLKKQGVSPVSVIAVDARTRANVEGALAKAFAKLEQPSLAAGALLESVMEIEFSEMNDVFLYVINSCQPYSKTFQHMASIIQTHEDRIEQYLERHQAGLQADTRARSLPKVWNRRILVADDVGAIRELWKRILERTFNAEVVTAENGKTALDLIRSQFFNLVITDMEMPALNGKELYQKAVQEDARMKGLFIFCTGYATDEIKSLAASQNIPLLEKPVALHVMKEAIQQAWDAGTQELTPNGPARSI